MSENNKETQQPTPAPVAPQKKSFVDELKKNGSVVITAKTREEIAEMVNNIPAEVKYGAGAVGYDPAQRLYCLQIVLTK